MGLASMATPPAASTIRFQFDYEEIKSKVSGLNTTAMQALMTEAAAYISKYTKTYPKAFTIPPATTCNGVAIASNISATYSDIDLLVIVSAESNMIYQSTGEVCYYDTGFINRPALGKLTFSSEL
jgi:hypothetical protein